MAFIHVSPDYLMVPIPSAIHIYPSTFRSHSFTKDRISKGLKKKKKEEKRRDFIISLEAVDIIFEIFALT